MSKQVAEIILQQLGGKRFITMTGAKHLLADTKNNRLSMQLPSARHDGQRVSGVWITLMPNDTYKVDAIYIDRRLSKHRIVASREDVYCEDLQQIFSQLTGLATHL